MKLLSPGDLVFVVFSPIMVGILRDGVGGRNCPVFRLVEMSGHVFDPVSEVFLFRFCGVGEA